MNNISKINSYNMQNSEYLGLMLKLTTFASKLSAEEIVPSVTAFKADVVKLEKHLADNYSETVNKAAQRHNVERLAAYNALRYCVKGMTRSPDEATAAAGAKYWNIIVNTEDPRRANQDAVTKALAALITAFREFDTEELTTFGIESYVKILETHQAEFIAAAQTRGQMADARIERATRKYRKTCYDSFYALAYHAVARATNNGDAECVEFVEQANGELDLRKRQLKLRRTLAKKAAEEKEGSTVTQGDSGSEAGMTTATVQTTATQGDSGSEAGMTTATATVQTTATAEAA